MDGAAGGCACDSVAFMADLSDAVLLLVASVVFDGTFFNSGFFSGSAASLRFFELSSS